MKQKEKQQRQAFQFPKNSRAPLKGSKLSLNYSNKQFKRQSFDQFVKKTKNVVLFAQLLKQKISQRRTLYMHTLKQSQIQYLQCESQSLEWNSYLKDDSIIVTAIQSILLVSLIAFLWRSTYELVFLQNTNIIIDIIVFLFYVLHIVIFNLTQIRNDKYQVIKNLQTVHKIYLQRYFFLDFVTLSIIVCLMLSYYLMNEIEIITFIIFRCIGIITIIKIKDIGRNLQNKLASSNKSDTIIRITKLLFKIFVFIHFLSISLNIVAVIEDHNNIKNTWLTSQSIKKQPQQSFDKYVIGWYWGATILSTVGFGQITPMNNYERFFISIIQVFCCMSFGYFVNVIGTLIRFQAQNDEKYDKQMRSLNRYFNFIKVSEQLKYKIRNYFINRHIIQKIYDSEQQKLVLDHMTPSIKNNLMQQNNMAILKKSQHLQNFNQEFLLKLVTYLKRILLAPQHILYSRNTNDKKLWMIQSGSVDQYTDLFENCNLRKKISKYDERENTVGWISFITQNPYKSMARTAQFTVLYEIQQNDFKKELLHFRSQYHKYLSLKQTFIYKKKKYTSKCLSCQRYTHNTIECPRIHYNRREAKSIVCDTTLIFAKKYNRYNLHLNWKHLYQSGQLAEKANILCKGYEYKPSFLTIEQSIKGDHRLSMNKQHGVKRASTVSEYNSKISILQHRESQDYKFSTKLLQDLQFRNVEKQFQKVFFNKQVGDYNPSNDIQQVIEHYKKFIDSKK